MNKTAPKGKVYQCQACGKLSLDAYGSKAISYGWDVSCVLNAKLVKAKDIGLDLKNIKTYQSKE